MPIQIDAPGQPIEPDIPLEAVHGGQRPLILIKTGIHTAGGIINVTHEHTHGTAPFEPVVMGSVQLDHLAPIGLSLPPLTMRSLLAALVRDMLLLEPTPQRLVTYLDFVNL